MDSEEELAAVVVVYILKKKKKRKKKWKKRSTWVKPWLTRRDPLGFYNALTYELRTEEEHTFIPSKCK